MKILQNGTIQIGDIEFLYDNLALSIESEFPVQLQYAELVNDKWRLDYFINGMYQSQDLNLSEFKKILPQYDDILKQAKLLELNDFNEPKYKEIDNELVEQTEPSQDFIKNKLLAELKAYYEDCKNISITTDGITITHFFNSDWRDLLHKKISSLLLARGKNKPDTFTWMTSTGNAIMTIENLQELLLIVEEDIIQPNYNNFLAERVYISNNDVALDYDYKKNFLHNQVINL